MTRVRANKLVLVLLSGTLTMGFSMVFWGLSQRALGPIPRRPEGHQTFPARDGAGSPAQKYAYFLSCSGAYAKLDTSKNAIISQSSIWSSLSAASVRPRDAGAFDGCLVDKVQHASGSDMLYAVVPQEGRASNEGARHYWVV